MAMQPGFHDLMRQRLAEAEGRVVTLEAEVDATRNLVTAYRTIIQHEAQNLPPPQGEFPSPAAAVRPSMPPRVERFADGSIREAILTLAREWGSDPHHADQFAPAIWQINTQQELRQVKRTLNSELGRCRRAGTLQRVGRNRYVIAVAQPVLA